MSIGTGGVLPECGAAGNFCYSVHPSITPDGRYVAFASVVQNIVPGPQTPSPTQQILVHDRHTCTTVRISETPDGQPADKSCETPSMSADGQVVVFRSRANNLAPNVPNLVDQIYVYDAATSSVELISKGPGGGAGNADSSVPEISHDGRYICFQSSASNLVPGDTNDQPDIFVHDRQTDELRRVNVNENGQQANSSTRRPSMTADGRYIVFDSSASNLVATPFSSNQVFLLDRDSDADGVFDEDGETTLTLVSVNDAGEPSDSFCSWGVASPDGRMVVFSSSADDLVDGDTNGTADVFVHHLDTGTTTRESVGPGGEQTSTGSWFPFSFSADSRYLTFHSGAQELVRGGHNGVTHIVRRDLEAAENLIISRSTDGAFADLSSEVAVLTATGDTVAFTSAAENLHPELVNHGWVNIYVRALRPTDVTGDGVVDVADLLLLLGQWGDDACAISDINADDQVDVADLLELLADWG